MSTTKEIDTGPKYDRLKHLKEFDESKIGVKGLVDRGLSTIPSFFVHPDSSFPPTNSTRSRHTIPVIDFSCPREILVQHIRESASSFGFFQIIDHGIPLETINHLLNSVTSFNELPESEKMKYYSRDMSHGAAFSTNFDLYKSKAASWRDTLQLRLAPTPPDWDHVPSACKEAIINWDKGVLAIGEKLLGLLCEGLGLRNIDVLKEMSCLEARIMASHYYPYCPQPELTAGLTSHSDPGVLTVLVQNEIPGLQVKVGEEWLDVEPVEGAIVINIGDILQIMSNDRYISVEHRVLANPCKEPRVSVAVFFNPSLRDKMFGPLSELLSDAKPAHYQHFTFAEYMKRFFSKELDGKTLTNYYRL
ncbi:1-aminocyclopropane-1-carboxylate oxidase homolog 1-like [Olea europaea var. sylvestris]|uniref:1-aminocyclopropane-1-carboxylate oxidase homolog 1-like n=1 Tax=Olea europaea var. sylvestris TaxID=158386 RepID=UPI000C1D22A5|nr:1-aminocyclopropane-1-carboxylate oxidase homolog 1-like [Olea europaea var. sylvestris]